MSLIIGCPIPKAEGFCVPEGLCTRGVMILLEALGEEEVKDRGLPARPSAPAGSVLERAIRRSGFQRDNFVLWNTVPTHPPKNYLDGAPYEDAAIAWGTPYIQEVIDRFKPRVILACGNVALRACTGLGKVMLNRGFPIQSRFGIPVIGTLHPSFLRRGAMSYLGVLMHDLRFAVALAETGETQPHVKFWSPILWRETAYDHYAIRLRLADLDSTPPGYIERPTEITAAEFEYELKRDPTRMLAYDIETPYSHAKGEDETDDLEEHVPVSIQFSLARDTGIFLPWRYPFIDIAKAILASPNPKIGANNWRFDDPRLRLQGCQIKGSIHDVRWAWKHFQPDLSGALQFIASFYAPEMGPWKHLAQSRPQWYGIRDVDVLHRII